jgi:hypothetical protein
MIMTNEDRVYADWLDLLGSDEITDKDPAIAQALHRLHDAAEASHGPADADAYYASMADALRLGTEA